MILLLINRFYQQNKYKNSEFHIDQVEKNLLKKTLDTKTDAMQCTRRDITPEKNLKTTTEWSQFGARLPFISKSYITLIKIFSYKRFFFLSFYTICLRFENDFKNLLLVPSHNESSDETS